MFKAAASVERLVGNNPKTSSLSGRAGGRFRWDSITVNSMCTDESSTITQAQYDCSGVYAISLNVVSLTVKRCFHCIKSHNINPFINICCDESQGLVDVLLASSVKRQITIGKKTAENLFEHLWLTSCSAAQLSIAALLSQSDDSSRWMPNFLAEMLRKTLSSDASTALIPKDRFYNHPFCNVLK